MAEIKSTLDLVMERTRHLTLTADEKARQENEALAQKINGVLQRYRDGALPMEAVKRRVDELGEARGSQVLEQTVRIILKQVELSVDNGAMLELLAGQFDVDCRHLSHIIEGYQDARRAELDRQSAELKQQLATTHSIGGTAVLPNLEADAVWAGCEAALRERIDPDLAREKARILETL